ncbi:hypothetical protein EYF80_015432 [Liparis tanakae]|uniref:Uncharacterized protein n=1 Tax=Liparis tanakae TaxID=230148 RepID=A0A4Z2I8G5_9TELE|nr:hypothetical protein EYF80_015432 [Liparis tanakae]
MQLHGKPEFSHGQEEHFTRESGRIEFGHELESVSELPQPMSCDMTAQGSLTEAGSRQAGKFSTDTTPRSMELETTTGEEIHLHAAGDIQRFTSQRVPHATFPIPIRQ